MSTDFHPGTETPVTVDRPSSTDIAGTITWESMPRPDRIDLDTEARDDEGWLIGWASYYPNVLGYATAQVHYGRTDEVLYLGKFDTLQQAQEALEDWAHENHGGN